MARRGQRLREQKAGLELEITQKTLESAGHEMPSENGEMVLSANISLPNLRHEADTSSEVVDQEDQAHSDEHSARKAPSVDESSTVIAPIDICLNFNKRQCRFGQRCKRRHIRIPSTRFQEIETGIKCRYSSKEECTYKGCQRVHSLEESADPQAPRTSAHCERANDGRGDGAGVLYAQDDRTSEGELAARPGLLFSNGSGEIVVRLPSTRKLSKASRKAHRKSHRGSPASSLLRATDTTCDVPIISNSWDAEGLQSCLPLSFSGTDSEQPISAVHLRRITLEESRNPPNDSTEDARNDVDSKDCMFCVLGLCNGQRCQATTSSNELVVPEGKEERQDHDQFTRQPCKDLTVTLFSRMKVTMGPGMLVSNIATANESSSIIISNLPSFVQEDDVRNICIRFGVVKSVRISGRDHANLKAQSEMLTAKVDFETFVQAKKAVNKLNGTKRFFSVLRAVICFPGWGRDPAVGMLDNTLVRVDMPVPGRTVFLGRSSLNDAQRELVALHGTSVRGGNTISATLYEGLPRIGEYTVKVEGLPADICDEEIRALCRSDGPVLLGRVTNLSVLDAVSVIRPYLDECGEIIKCDLPTPALPKDGRLYGMVQFSVPEAASTASLKLNGRRLACFGGEKIYAAHLHTISYSIDSRIFAVIQPDIRNLQDLAHGYNLQLIVVPRDDYGKTRIKLLADGGVHILKRVKYPLERLLSGQKVQMQSGPVWDVFFGLRMGMGFIAELARFTGTFIRADEFTGRITVWGAANARAQASRQIIKKAVQLQSTRTFNIPFAPGTISKLLSSDFLAIQDMLGEHNVDLDLSARCLRIRGNHTQYLRVSALLQGRGPYRSDVPLVLSNETCPVCLSSVIEPVSLECAHKTCKSCLSRYISSSVAHRSFPLRCLAGDATCPEPIPVSLCRRLLPADEFINVVEASFQSYTAARPHEFRRCPSANCAQVYKLENESKSQPLQCPSCLIRVCPFCHEEEHRGYQCLSMEKEDEKLYSEWKAAHNVHPCPNCHADIEKVAGCNHMTCSQCGTHMCWECLTTFADGSEVYHHMRDVHGGIG